MPRNMSFALTVEQMRNRTKTVTRRLGWEFAKPGDVVNAVVKSRGLKKGETIELIGQIRFTDVRREPLAHIRLHEDDVAREGFPGWLWAEFVAHFLESMGCEPDVIVTRIEFEHL